MTLRKTHNNHTKRLKTKNHIVKFGNFGLQSSKFIQLTNNQKILWYSIVVNALKKLNNRKTKIWNLITLNKTSTKQNIESRMGKGKGAISEQITFIEANKILFEFNLNYNQYAKSSKLFQKSFFLLKSKLVN